MIYVENDHVNGPDSMLAAIMMMNPAEFKIIRGEELSHTGMVLYRDSRCNIFNEVLAKINKVEAERACDREEFRSRVETCLERLPFGDGCDSQSS